MKIDVEVLQQIENYVSGKLTVDESEKLWMELLKNREYFNYFLVYKELNTLYETKENEESVDPAFE